MGGLARMLAPGPDWDAELASLEAAGRADVYFDHRYLSLYLAPDERAEAFSFCEDGRRFLLPYLRRPIAAELCDAPCWDFETAYGYGGPVSDSDDPEFLARAWRAFDEHCRRTGLVVGFLRFHPLLENHRLAAYGRAEVSFNRHTVWLDLGQGPEDVWAGYAKDNQGRIRKAQRAGLVVERHQDAGSMAGFARVYRQCMRDLGADSLYFWGEDYFNRLAELGPARVRLYLATLEGRLVGGAVVLLGGPHAHYHLSAAYHQDRGLAPNNLLRHAVIADLLGGPWQRLHFGGGTTTDPQDSLFQFKQRFSRTLGDFYVARYVADPDARAALVERWARLYPEQAASHGRLALCHRFVGE